MLKICHVMAYYLNSFFVLLVVLHTYNDEVSKHGIDIGVKDQGQIYLKSYSVVCVLFFPFLD